MCHITQVVRAPSDVLSPYCTDSLINKEPQPPEGANTTNILPKYLLFKTYCFIACLLGENQL